MASLLIKSIFLLALCGLAQSTRDGNKGRTIERRIDNYNALYLQLFDSNYPPITPDVAFEILNRMKFIESDPNFMPFLAMTDRQNRQRSMYLRSSWDTANQLRAAKQSLVPEGLTNTDNLLKLYEYESSSCFPDDLKKLIGYLTIEEPDAPFSDVIKYLVCQHFIVCLQRQRIALNSGRALLATSDITCASQMVQQIVYTNWDALEASFRDMSQNGVKLFKTNRGLAQYFVDSIHNRKYSNRFALARALVPEEFGNLIYQPCERICTLNMRTHTIYTQFELVYTVTGMDVPPDPELDVWKQMIEICCDIVSRSAEDLMKNLMIHLKLLEQENVHLIKAQSQGVYFRPIRPRPVEASPSEGVKRINTGLPRTGSGISQIGAGISQVGAGFQRTPSGLILTGAGPDQTGAGTSQMGAGLQRTPYGHILTGAGLDQTGAGTSQMGAGLQRTPYGHILTGAGPDQTGAGTSQMGAGLQRNPYGIVLSTTETEETGAGTSQIGAVFQRTPSGLVMSTTGPAQTDPSTSQMPEGSQRGGSGDILTGSEPAQTGPSTSQMREDISQTGAGNSQAGEDIPQTVADTTQVPNPQTYASLAQTSANTSQAGTGTSEAGVDNSQAGKDTSGPDDDPPPPPNPPHRILDTTGLPGWRTVVPKASSTLQLRHTPLTSGRFMIPPSTVVEPKQLNQPAETTRPAETSQPTETSQPPEPSQPAEQSFPSRHTHIRESADSSDWDESE